MYGVSSQKHEILNARKEMGAVIETPAIYLDMTATGNLKEQYCVLGIRSFDTIPQLLKIVGLENTGWKKAKNFSLGIAIALVGNPRFLVLDEPVNGKQVIIRTLTPKNKPSFSGGFNVFFCMKLFRQAFGPGQSL